MAASTDNSPPALRRLDGARVKNDLSDSVGARLQALRQKYGLSQRELARRAEVTNSTLSMIEQGKVSPSVGSLEKILLAFPLSLQEFFSDSLELTPPVVGRDDFVSMQRDDAEFRILPLTVGEGFEGVFLAEQTFVPGANLRPQWMINTGFVGGVVIEGKIDLELDGVIFNLSTGDGFNFSLQRDHIFANRSDTVCRIVCVSFNE